MGSWGHGLVESDTAYDYLDELDAWFPSRQLYKLISDDISEKELSWTKEVLKNNKYALRKIALTSYKYDKDIYILIYIAFLKYFEMQLDEEDKKEFELAYKGEFDNLGMWSEPDERTKELERIKYSVDNNLKYEFNAQGLFEKILKENS